MGGEGFGSPLISGKKNCTLAMMFRGFCAQTDSKQESKSVGNENQEWEGECDLGFGVMERGVDLGWWL